MSIEIVRDPVLTHEWHGVYKADDLKDKPVQVNIMGELIVLFRTKNGVHAFKDLCVHRGSALSLGTVENDTIVCPYHGWSYDSEGKCVCIPSQSKDKKIPDRAKALPYSCREDYGLIWVNIGEPSSFPMFHEYDDSNFRSTVSGPYTVQAAAPRIIENFLDFAHLMWVHNGILGEKEFSEIPAYKVNETEHGLETEEVKIYQANAQWGGEATSIYVKSALRPTTAKLRKTNADSGDVVAILINTVPIKPNLTLVHMVTSRDFSKDEATDRAFLENNALVFGQDVAILENQKPEELPLDLQAELNHPSDQMSISYRRWLRELGVQFGIA
ncbi:aromatic ring-hydroxylating oxygenase subunit alpha [Paenibacillus hamazuiensis]|uniref:aromatic ring-hydroxylating oxygenase subunit alpha n=1 Tax=Paenibacillus hamazuiensis TaxID=2936508 RepID=UPI00200E4854|nr:aromatic ring-hydroxylating dioxygenase subunit alpha [Paenibacillus hamazuiensis]